MNAFISALLTLSLTTSFAIVLVMLVGKALTNKISATFKYYMWLIVLLALLIPFRPRFTTPFSAITLPPVLESVYSPEPPIEEKGIKVSDPELSVKADQTDTKASSQNKLYNILFVVWISIVFLILAIHFIIYIKFSSSVRRWGTVVDDSEILTVLETVWLDMGYTGRPLQVKECLFLTSPMLFGFRRPAILLPEKEITPDELSHIFRHELTHYKHKDLWFNLLVLLISALHWFNPLVWFMSKVVRTDCEAACDEAVVNGNNTEERKCYGETIIGFIGARNARTPILSTYFYGGKSSMKKRLFSIMDMSKKRAGLAAVYAVVIVSVIFLSGTLFAYSKEKAEYIGEAKAKSIALTHAGLSESQVNFVKVSLDRDDRHENYDVEFYNGTTEYDYEIDALSGDILKYDQEIEQNGAAGKNPVQNKDETKPVPYIEEAKAKEAALAHAGLSESEVTFVKTNLNQDDGRVDYDVEFYSGNTEYDYEIDAQTGDIIEFDRDIDDYTIPAAPNQGSAPPASNTTNQPIDEAQAKTIALNHAGLSESQVTHLNLQFDQDDGTTKYEIDFKNGWTEYEYEIDAATGTILKADTDQEDD